MWTRGLTFAVVLLAGRAVSMEGGQGDCKCVPYYLCPSGSSQATSAQHNIRRKCENYLEVCCEVSADTVHFRPPVAKAPGCGRRGLTGGAGSNEARFGEFPWVVVVMEKAASAESQCGGSLIHPKVVLTGAHCVAGKEPHKLKIRAGEWDMNTDDEPLSFQERNVERIVVHEQFMEGNLFNDVALLFLSRAVDAAENIGFTCVPEQGNTPRPGTRCFATGWGKDVSGEGSENPGVLKRIDVPVVGHPECQAALRNTILGRHFKLHQSFMCAGGEDGRDTCKGDGGSPLMCPLPDNPGIFIQSGIVAWGIGCGRDQNPGVYADVAFFRDWIDEQMNKANLDQSYYSHRQK